MRAGSGSWPAPARPPAPPGLRGRLGSQVRAAGKCRSAPADQHAHPDAARAGRRDRLQLTLACVNGRVVEDSKYASASSAPGRSAPGPRYRRRCRALRLASSVTASSPTGPAGRPTHDHLADPERRLAHADRHLLALLATGARGRDRARSRWRRRRRAPGPRRSRRRASRRAPVRPACPPSIRYPSVTLKTNWPLVVSTCPPPRLTTYRPVGVSARMSAGCWRPAATIRLVMRGSVAAGTTAAARSRTWADPARGRACGRSGSLRGRRLRHSRVRWPATPSSSTRNEPRWLGTVASSTSVTIGAATRSPELAGVDRAIPARCGRPPARARQPRGRARRPSRC